MKVLVACSGGGLRGAFQVGAIQALAERGIIASAWTGVSTGSIQAAVMAQAPAEIAAQTAMAARLRAFWEGLTSAPVSGGPLEAIARVILGRPSLHRATALRHLLEQGIMAAPQVPLELGAVSLDGGDYVGLRPTTVEATREAVLASAAIPAFFPPVGLSAYADGGVVHVAPLGPAFRLANALWPSEEPVTVVLIHCLPLDEHQLPPKPGPVTGMAKAALWRLIPRAVDLLETANERADLMGARRYNDLVRAYAGRADAPPWLAGKRYARLVQIAPAMAPGYDTLGFDAEKLRAYLAHGHERARAALAGWPA